jgi:hypothetical protein
MKSAPLARGRVMTMVVYDVLLKWTIILLCQRLGFMMRVMLEGVESGMRFLGESRRSRWSCKLHSILSSCSRERSWDVSRLLSLRQEQQPKRFSYPRGQRPHRVLDLGA